MGDYGRKSTIIGSATVLIICGFFFSSCTGGKTMEERFQRVLDRGVKICKVRGVSAAIVFGSDSIWTGTSGISHENVPMKPDMLFSIGSITKNFVAALTLKLAEDDILNLEDSLSEWLPDIPYVDPDITIRQLLNHTSGIYMFWDNDDIWDELIVDRNRVWTPEEVLAYIKEPYFLKGEGWRYSNTNYLLMAMIIDKATNSSLSSQLKHNLWEPLGLENYYLWLADSIPANQTHVFGDNFQFGSAEQDLTFLPRASHESITYGSSGIVTTAEDLAMWCFMLFEGNVLNSESMNEMLDFIDFFPEGNMKGYGLGVQLFIRKITLGRKAIGHGGGNIGSATYMIYLPGFHTSIVVMVNAFPTNSVDYFTSRLILQLIRSIR